MMDHAVPLKMINRPQLFSRLTSHIFLLIYPSSCLIQSGCGNMSDKVSFSLIYSVHYDDVIMSAIASQITSLTIVYSTVCPGADQSKHQSSASLAFVWGIHRRPVNSPHKWPVTRKMFPFDDVIMCFMHAERGLAWFASHLRSHLFLYRVSAVLCRTFYRSNLSSQVYHTGWARWCLLVFFSFPLIQSVVLYSVIAVG